jgi:hypothetical protein
MLSDLSFQNIQNPKPDQQKFLMIVFFVSTKLLSHSLLSYPTIGLGYNTSGAKHPLSK